jgi:hypothetical protein
VVPKKLTWLIYWDFVETRRRADEKHHWIEHEMDRINNERQMAAVNEEQINNNFNEIEHDMGNLLDNIQ